MRGNRISHFTDENAGILAVFLGKAAWNARLVAIGLCFGTVPAAAQVTRLPDTGATQSLQEPILRRPATVAAPAADPPSPFEPPLGSVPDVEGPKLWEPALDSAGRPPADPPGDWRQLVRKTSFNGAWLAGGGADGLGIAELRASTTVIVPVPVFSSPLMVSPSFGATFLNPPGDMELPGELYRVAANIMWMTRVSDRMGLMLGVTPGVSSDFKATAGAFRIFGYGAATYQWTPTTQWIAGIAYLNRNDIPILPMVGLVWTPDDDTRLELTMPKPRFAKRIHWHGAWASDAEDWIYLAGELGGGTYAVRQAADFDNEMTLRDFRFILGVERKTQSGLTGHAEVGYVFGRKVEFKDDMRAYRPSDTVLLRAGLSY